MKNEPGVIVRGITSTAMREVLLDIGEERDRQDLKWGQQNHPDGTSAAYVKAANASRYRCDQAAKNKTLTWRHIADEEFSEALAETDQQKLRTELIQTAAVLVAWIECIDRRGAK